MVFMSRLLSSDIKSSIKTLRQRGHSLPEIAKKLHVGKATVFRYIQGVEILDSYKKEWHQKRGGSIKRKLIKEKEADNLASIHIPDLNQKEILVFISALYWGEGSKGDLNIVNSDPKLLRSIIIGLRSIFGIKNERIRVGLRIFEGMSQKKCIDYWSKELGIPVNLFSNTNVIFGRKIGKLPYGMCRLRIVKGGDMLKYLKAVYTRVFKLLESSHSSSG